MKILATFALICCFLLGCRHQEAPQLPHTPQMRWVFDTLDVQQTLGAKTIHHEWEGKYSSGKVSYMQLSKGLSPKLLGKLNKTLNQRAIQAYSNSKVDDLFRDDLFRDDFESKEVYKDCKDSQNIRSEVTFLTYSLISIHVSEGGYICGAGSGFYSIEKYNFTLNSQTEIKLYNFFIPYANYRKILLDLGAPYSIESTDVGVPWAFDYDGLRIYQGCCEGGALNSDVIPYNKLMPYLRADSPLTKSLRQVPVPLPH